MLSYVVIYLHIALLSPPAGHLLHYYPYQDMHWPLSTPQQSQDRISVSGLNQLNQELINVCSLMVTRQWKNIFLHITTDGLIGLMAHETLQLIQSALGFQVVASVNHWTSRNLYWRRGRAILDPTEIQDWTGLSGSVLNCCHRHRFIAFQHICCQWGLKNLQSLLHEITTVKCIMHR